MAAVKVSDLELGQLVGWGGSFGHLVAVTPYMRQEGDGTVITDEKYVILYFRSKPMSPRGKLRGVPMTPFATEADGMIYVPEEQS